MENLTDTDFETLRECLLTGSSNALSEEKQKMLQICRDCYGLISKYPNRIHLIHAVESLHGISYRQAARYVDFVRKTWGNLLDYNLDFIRTFFLNQLLTEIAKPNTPPAARAKNLATLQKYIAATPQADIDPSLMESNTVVINFVLGDKNFQVPQKDFRKLPKDMQERLLASVHYEISDTEAEEILNS